MGHIPRARSHERAFFVVKSRPVLLRPWEYLCDLRHIRFVSFKAESAPMAGASLVQGRNSRQTRAKLGNPQQNLAARSSRFKQPMRLVCLRQRKLALDWYIQSALRVRFE
jgi:hypothetical protein